MNKLVKVILFAAISFGILSTSNAKDYTIQQLPSLQPDDIHETVARRVTNYFTQSHYRDFKLDDEFSAKIFDRYLKQLDYGKLIFTTSDIEQFKGKETQIARELKTGQLVLAYELYNLSLEKRFIRYQYALGLLKEPMNFDTDEEIDYNSDDKPWAASEQELDDYWRARVRYDELSLALTGKTEDEIREALTKRYTRALKTLTQTNSEDAFQVFMNAFAREIDPHTSYLAPRKKRDFDADMSLSFEGIGATLSQEDDYTVIMSFVTGGPAERSGLLSIGDRIIGVGQKGQSIEDVIGWRLDDVVELIRGPKETTVVLEILPSGSNSKPKTIELIRDTIRFEDREAKLSVVENERGKVGVIEIPGFYMGLTDKVKELLGEMEKDNVSSLVIDLRNNGGGSLAEVISLTGLFIESGPVVQVRDNLQKIIQYDDRDGVVYYKGPMVVIVNRYSASASEIFSAAMQDYGRAVIVGETTFGKGTVQTSRNIAYPMDEKLHPDWPALGGVQYTIQKFYRINGGSTQLKGVEPDIAMTKTQLASETGERFMDNALPWDSIRVAKYQSLRNIASILPELNRAHAVRISNNPEFAYIEEDIIRYNAEKDRQYIVSLNKAKREQEQAENDKRELDRTNERLTRAGLPVIKNLDELPEDYKAPDAFLDEAVQIAQDMVPLYPEIEGKSFNDVVEETLRSKGQIFNINIGK
ncbi:carboxy terminal-processing peptidase [Zophobihabitans entericus]|uniref:Carboxy terminal-processing peptidase n=1 Tax=Zophobihabitans entericus TaxID=1635327 RepID=A0A6G9IDF6_9GAMM|nr:carboxy terminal-processing peptidase [Zophobihabitans entericus]QIQ22268.1 carboxy terminal-processing peptidase [Zophobihabitans entericus]